MRCVWEITLSTMTVQTLRFLNDDFFLYCHRHATMHHKYRIVEGQFFYYWLVNIKIDYCNVDEHGQPELFDLMLFNRREKKHSNQRMRSETIFCCHGWLSKQRKKHWRTTSNTHISSMIWLFFRISNEKKKQKKDIGFSGERKHWKWEKKEFLFVLFFSSIVKLFHLWLMS